jgi:hypothetical protein
LYVKYLNFWKSKSFLTFFLNRKEVLIGGPNKCLAIPATDLEYKFDPQFNTTGDVISIKLKNRIDPSSGIQPINWPTSDLDFNEELRMLVWTQLNNDNMDLREVMVKIVANEKCQELYSPYNITIDFRINFCVDTGCKFMPKKCF